MLVIVGGRGVRIARRACRQRYAAARRLHNKRGENVDGDRACAHTIGNHLQTRERERRVHDAARRLQPLL